MGAYIPTRTVASLTGGGADSPQSERIFDSDGHAPTLDRRMVPSIAIRTAQTNSNGWGVGTDEQAYTLDGAQGQAVNGVRRLTPLECERLMGWPDDWTRYAADGKEIKDSHRYRMCGNGVVATVAEWIGRRLVAVDLQQRSTGETEVAPVGDLVASLRPADAGADPLTKPD